MRLAIALLLATSASGFITPAPNFAGVRTPTPIVAGGDYNYILPVDQDKPTLFLTWETEFNTLAECESGATPVNTVPLGTIVMGGCTVSSDKTYAFYATCHANNTITVHDNMILPDHDELLKVFDKDNHDCTKDIIPILPKYECSDTIDLGTAPNVEGCFVLAENESNCGGWGGLTVTFGNTCTCAAGSDPYCDTFTANPTETIYQKYSKYVFVVEKATECNPGTDVYLPWKEVTWDGHCMGDDTSGVAQLSILTSVVAAFGAFILH